MTEPMTDRQLGTARIAASHETDTLLDEIERLRKENETVWKLLNGAGNANLAHKEVIRKDREKVERLEDLGTRSCVQLMETIKKMAEATAALDGLREKVHDDREAMQAAIEAHTSGCPMGCPVCRPLEARLRKG